MKKKITKGKAGLVQGPDINGVLLPGGATRSEVSLPYDLIPPSAIRALADRFRIGVGKHGEDNWKNSLDNRSNAYAFCKEAYNHLVEHCMKMLEGTPDEHGGLGGHLAAIMWGATVLIYAEEKFGCSWTEL